MLSGLAALVLVVVHGAAVAPAQAPSRVAGTWMATDLQRALAAFTEGITTGLSLDQVDGALMLTIEADGAYQAEYRNVGFSATVGGMTVSGTLDGAVSGTYREDGPGMLVGTVTAGTVHVSLPVFGQPMATDFPVPAGEETAIGYECDGDQLTLAITNPFDGSIATAVLVRSG